MNRTGVFQNCLWRTIYLWTPLHSLPFQHHGVFVFHRRWRVSLGQAAEAIPSARVVRADFVFIYLTARSLHASTLIIICLCESAVLSVRAHTGMTICCAPMSARALCTSAICHSTRPRSSCTRISGAAATSSASSWVSTSRRARRAVFALSSTLRTRTRRTRDAFSMVCVGVCLLSFCFTPRDILSVRARLSLSQICASFATLSCALQTTDRPSMFPPFSQAPSATTA